MTNTRYAGQLKADGMLFDTLAESRLTENQKQVSQRRAAILESLAKEEKKREKWIEAIMDKRDIGQKLVGCQKCKDRWENPHRSYEDSEIAAFIDKDKIG